MGTSVSKTAGSAAADVVVISREETEFFRLAQASAAELARSSADEADRAKAERWHDAMAKVRCWRSGGCRVPAADHTEAFAALVSLQRFLLRAAPTVPATARATQLFMAAPDPSDVASATRSLEAAKRTGWFVARRVVGGARREKETATPKRRRAPPTVCKKNRRGEDVCYYGTQGRSVNRTKKTAKKKTASPP